MSSPFVQSQSVYDSEYKSNAIHVGVCIFLSRFYFTFHIIFVLHGFIFLLRHCPDRCSRKCFRNHCTNQKKVAKNGEKDKHKK